MGKFQHRTFTRSVGAACTCGRVIEKYAHCPGCGSQNCYASSTYAEWDKDADGNLTLYNGYRCRRCSLGFSDKTPCEAPPYAEKRGRKRATVAEGEPTITAKQSQAIVDAVASLRKKRGLE